MQKVQRAVAMTLVATALCADRAATAAPMLRPQTAVPAAQTLVGRLTTCLRHVVPGVRLYQVRGEGRTAPANIRAVIPASIDITPPPISPFRFRLPPPVV
jgi:hypothetical protein